MTHTGGEKQEIFTLRCGEAVDKRFKISSLPDFNLVNEIRSFHRNYIYGISVLCLIIKGLDNQAQKLNNQINQYPKKSLIVTLVPQTYCMFHRTSPICEPFVKQTPSPPSPGVSSLLTQAFPARLSAESESVMERARRSGFRLPSPL
jgi:hypothetical protein